MHWQTAGRAVSGNCADSGGNDGKRANRLASRQVRLEGKGYMRVSTATPAGPVAGSGPQPMSTHDYDGVANDKHCAGATTTSAYALRLRIGGQIRQKNGSAAHAAETVVPCKSVGSPIPGRGKKTSPPHSQCLAAAPAPGKHSSATLSPAVAIQVAELPPRAWCRGLGVRVPTRYTAVEARAGAFRRHWKILHR